ncbi:MAG TPA: peroxiredoxin [Nitrososphaerales archaeon]|nr:peroxiredoxin [Nitrososphaerales archaeon]
MSLRINDVAPDFKIDTTQGEIEFHNWIGEGWAVLFSHPKDFTPVCTTELGALAELESEFLNRNTKVIGLSVDSVDDHLAWLNDIAEVTGFRPNYPLIADTELSIAKLYGMLPASTEGSCVGRTAADNQTVRSVFIIGPDKKIKLHLSYPMATGRNFKEILRIIDSLQLTVQHKLATPANWKKGDDVIIVPAVKDEEAKSLFPDDWKTVKPYIRLIADPSTK